MTAALFPGEVRFERPGASGEIGGKGSPGGRGCVEIGLDQGAVERVGAVCEAAGVENPLSEVGEGPEEGGRGLRSG